MLAAAAARADALVRRDAAALERLLHPALRWTTYRGDVLDRAAYIEGNTAGELVWRGQRLEGAGVAVDGDTAVLVAVVVDEVERDGERAVFRLRLTQTWVRSGDGAWVCLAGHAGPEVD